ncbi:arsenical-resistance protein [Fonsecaea monophora]|uniref:Arsenical-resistance protein n=1 Tax=Fonsecaea monophora TaxID=254056 RepID=A0A177F0N7_9EURO|nr:arsenical-resistance protein [Fonsecaea monophora]OAG37808.1 arsenical-resistance protein [Fonsecaea monophora]
MDFQNKEAVLAPEVSAEVSPSIAPQDLEQQPDNEPRLSIHTSAFRSLGILDQFLALWIFLAMLTGILLGNFVPSTGPTLQKGEFVGVSIPIVSQHSVVPPDTDGIQLGLAWAFLPDEPGLRDGLILVGIARCIAMVLIWTGLAGGDNEYCAILVAINSLLQMVLFAPLALLFINVISQSSEGVNVDYAPVAKSVGVFLGIPLAAAIVTRFSLRNLVGQDWYEKRFLKWIGPLSLIGLLFTIIVLFGSQGRRVVHQIVSVVRVAAPLIVYFAVIFLSTLVITRRLNFGYRLACTQSFTAASNNFELAIAVAIATYGVNSDQALAATVGPLIEVPVLLGLVYAVKWFGKRKNWTA